MWYMQPARRVWLLQFLPLNSRLSNHGQLLPYRKRYVAIHSIASSLVQSTTDDHYFFPQLNDTKLGQLSTYPHSRSPFATFNYENRIRRGDVSATPLQFVYEAADCRIFYTSEMHTNISTMWNRVANMAFGNSSSPRQDWSRNPYCVRDSTGHRSSISIGGPNNTDYAGSAPPAVAKSRAQLPLMPDGQRMGWRLNLTTAANNGVVV